MIICIYIWNISLYDYENILCVFIKLNYISIMYYDAMYRKYLLIPYGLLKIYLMLNFIWSSKDLNLYLKLQQRSHKLNYQCKEGFTWTPYNIRVFCINTNDKLERKQSRTFYFSRLFSVQHTIKQFWCESAEWEIMYEKLASPLKNHNKSILLNSPRIFFS